MRCTKRVASEVILTSGDKVISAYTRTDAIKFRNTCLTSIRCQCEWFASKSLGVLSTYYNVNGLLGSVDIKFKWPTVFFAESCGI